MTMIDVVEQNFIVLKRMIYILKVRLKILLFEKKS